MTRTIDIALFIAQLAAALFIAFFGYLNLLYATLDTPVAAVDYPDPGGLTRIRNDKGEWTPNAGRGETK